MNPTVNSTTTSSSASGSAPPSPLQSFLDAIESGRGADLGPLYAAEARVDLTVPNWRYEVRGRDDISANYANWFAFPGHFEEIDTLPTPLGVVVTYLLVWEEPAGPHAAHHTHNLEIVDGLIQRDTVFCGGRWSAELQAQMAEAANAI